MAAVLEGLSVLDLSVWRPGPYATQLLAEMGAEVVKVEPPGGDPMRAFPELFKSLNAMKRSVQLDLKDDDDRATALSLASDADVVVEGFRPGVAARLGVSHADVVALNPSVVYCSISGFGQTGSMRDAPGHDLNFQAWAGALSPDGAPPVVPRIPVGDLAAGMAAAMAICAACVRRARTGDGAYVDLGVTDVLATWTGAVAARFADAEEPSRAMPGYGVFATADGHVTLGVLGEDHFWAALCTELDLPYGELRFADRVGRLDQLQSEIANALGSRPRDDVVAALLDAGVPVAPVLSRDEMLALPHLRERGSVVGDGTSVGPPVRIIP